MAPSVTSSGPGHSLMSTAQRDQVFSQLEIPVHFDCLHPICPPDPACPLFLSFLAFGCVRDES